MTRRLAAAIGLAAAVALGWWLALPPEPPPPPVGLPGTPAALAPTHTNRLVGAPSAYLRQHAHDPVNWFPWGDEAFALAAREGKPVLLSIGYATCHWCHVMHDESFRDPAIAAQINAHFVPIKVDRELRPDVDAHYLRAVAAVTGRAGWPATLVLDAQRRPIFAGAYLPPRAGDRGRDQGLVDVLEQVRAAWTSDRAGLLRYAEQLDAHIRDPARSAGAPDPAPSPDAALAEVVRRALEVYDPEHGGARGAPSFWSDLPLGAMLLAAHQGDAAAGAAALRTLDAIAAGAVHDHLNGGFHRYAVDAAWRVPHFEKMLTDQAQLARLYLEALQLTGTPRYGQIASRTLDGMVEQLELDGGGFASALDAVSPDATGARVEGAWWTFDRAELGAALGDRADAFAAAYHVVGEGRFAGRHALWLDVDAAPALAPRFRAERLQLRLVQRERAPPARDDKLVTAYNGLAIGALAHGGWLLGREDWIRAARVAASRVLATADRGSLRRTERSAAGSGFLDDHAYLADGLLALFEATGEARWLDEAAQIVDRSRERFGAPEGPWYLEPDTAGARWTGARPVQDGPLPSPNAVTLGVLLRLAALTGDDRYRADADALAAGLPLARSGDAARVWGARPLLEVVIVREADERSSGLHAALRRLPVARRALVLQTAGEPPVAPIAADKLRLDGPTAYVCVGGVCDRPTTDPQTLAAQLGVTQR